MGSWISWCSREVIQILSRCTQGIFQNSSNFSLQFFWKIMIDVCFILHTIKVMVNFRVRVTVGIRVRNRFGALETSK